MCRKYVLIVFLLFVSMVFLPFSAPIRTEPNDSIRELVTALVFSALTDRSWQIDD